MANVTMIVGCPASGKSTLAAKLIKKGFVHLNRDTEGGKVRSLLPKMEQLLRDNKNVVLDNLFTTVAERTAFIAAAKQLGAQIDCQWMTTSIEEAQVNACQRMMERYHHILTPDEIKASKDPNMFPPAVLFKYRKDFQKPTTGEGFESVQEVPFVRQKEDGYETKGLILDYDGTLRSTVGDVGDRTFPIYKHEIKTLPKRTDILKKYRNDGYVLLGVSNQSGVAKGLLGHDTARELFEHTNTKLQIHIDYRFCPHKIPPISCYCRKPMPGFFVELAYRYKLDPSRCIMVGDLTSDKTFAQRCGMQYVDQAEFFQ